MKEDPFAHRERARYTKPIASRELIIHHLEELKKPCSIFELEKVLQINAKVQKDALAKRVRAMIRDGQIMTNRKQQLMLVGEMPVKKARVEIKKNATALLHVLSDEDSQEQLILNQQQVREVMHDDIVLVRLTKKNEGIRRLAILVDILERGVSELVGCLTIEEGITYLTPVNKLYRGSILVKKSKKKLTNGQYVLVQIVHYPTRHKEMIVDVIQQLGDHNKAGFERLLAVRSFNLPDSFSQKTLQEAKKLQAEGVGAPEIGRQDLTHLGFITIDGADARDFDDAIWVEKKTSGWCLYVAIADVSHYVEVDGAIDRDAFQRATSVYLPGSVIPMLPEALSNDLCSLVPKQRRFVIVAQVEIDYRGKVSRFNVHKAVIQSHARLTYTEAAHMITTGHDIPTWLKEPLKNMVDCYDTLLYQRKQRGSIDFDFPETKILFNDAGKIDQIVQVERNIAHKMIEEFMLVANEQVANFLIQKQLPGLFRVHKPPESKRVEALVTTLDNYNIHFNAKSDYKPKDFQNLLKKIHLLEHHDGLDSMVLTTMTQAYYDNKNGGHFGLAYKNYCHFTSPIRRYPDLLVHRAITSYLQDMQANKMSITKELAKHCSTNERRADDASRYIANWLKCDYMLDKVGNIYDGTICGVKSFGVFVKLDKYFIDGLVHITQLKNDYYDLDQVGCQLVGRRTQKVYKLGQAIKVRVSKIDQVENLIDFEEVNSLHTKSKKE
ncbi:MAG: ribonuclease R [Pseudomonadota bacterium]|nr:ribonuclease R [Pseudomonadota bacterium]